MLKSYGITKDLYNYFTLDMYNYFLNKHLEQLNLMKGDFYSIEESRKQLKETNYTSKMQDKLIKFQKCVSMYGMTKVKQEYNNHTFNNYVQKLEKFNINVITIPKKYKKNSLKNLIIAR